MSGVQYNQVNPEDPVDVSIDGTACMEWDTFAKFINPLSVPEIAPGSVTNADTGFVRLYVNSTTQQLEYRLSDATVLQPPPGQYFSAYDAGGGVSVTGTWQDIPWDTETRKDSIYTHAANGTTVTIGADGDYKITADCTTTNSANGRTQSEIRLVVDTGGGFNEIGGTRRRIYNRNATQGDGSASITTITTFTDGDIIKLQSQVVAGSGTITTLADGCSLTIEKL